MFGQLEKRPADGMSLKGGFTLCRPYEDDLALPTTTLVTLHS